jgi:hypothetical protein
MKCYRRQLLCCKESLSLELKSYQQRVIDDLTSFLNYLERGVGVGESGG